MSDSVTKIPHKNGVRREFQILEKNVWDWVIEEKHKHGKLPSRKFIQNHALEIYRQAGHLDFKASLGWYRRWEKRYDLRKMRDSNTTPIQKLSRNENAERKSSNVEKDLQKYDGIFLNPTLENFSSETDKLIGNIEMIDSPSEFFNFSDSFDKSLDSADVYDTLKPVPDADNACIKTFMSELIDDFGKYFSENEKTRDTKRSTKFHKKSCVYDDDFKQKVIQYMKSHCVKEAAAKFNVHRDTISVWIKDDNFQKHLTEAINEKKNKIVITQEGVEKEKEFLNWLRENEKNNIIVSKTQVKSKITDICVPADIYMDSYWFIKYCHRYLSENGGNKTSKIQYSVQFQKLMVNYANKTSQIKAASVFNLARKQLFNWMRNIRSEKAVNKQQADQKLLQWYDSYSAKPHNRVIREKAKSFHCTEGTDISCSYTWYYNWCAKNNIFIKKNCDEEIVRWILESYDQNLNVSHQDVQQKALEIYQNNMEGDFKASSGWLLRFCRRYMHLLRRIPPLTVQLPVVYEENVKIFRRNVLSTKLAHQIDSDSFGIMDEVFLRLKPLGTIDSNNKKTLLRNCGMNNIQGTVMLACLANGFIFPPVLVLKDKNTCDKSQNYPILYHGNGIVDNDIMLYWLKNIWFKYVKSPNILLLDSFAPHDTENIKEYFKQENSFVEIIPTGCSSKLNPLIQVVTSSFQESIDRNCKKWFNTNSWQLGVNNSLLSSNDIINWVGKAYEAINTTSIKENVKKTFQEMDLISA